MAEVRQQSKARLPVGQKTFHLFFSALHLIGAYALTIAYPQQVRGLLKRYLDHGNLRQQFGIGTSSIS